MEELKIQSGELLFNSKQKGQISAAHSRSKSKNAKELFCNTFIYEPENINEKPLGNLYMVGEIELPTKSKQHNSSYLINLIASIVKREYYVNPKRPPLESIESALNKANFALSDFAENGNVDWMHHLHFIIATIANNELHLTQTGYAKSLLLREEEITDISKTLPAKEKTLNPLKTFLHVASGAIEPNDKIIFATPELFNILSIEKLRRIIVLGDTEGNIKEIQKLIEESDTSSALGVIMIETPTIAYKPKIIQKGLEQIVIQSKEKRLNLQDIIKEELVEQEQEQEITPTPPEASTIFFKTIKELGGKSYIFIKRYSIPALKSLKEKTIQLSQKAKQKIIKETPALDEIRQEINIEDTSEITENELAANNFEKNNKLELSELIKKVKKVPQKTRVFIALTSVIILVFFISTYVSSRNKQKSELAEKTEIEEIINNTQNKITDAQNSLPANNRNMTNELLADATSLITKLQTQDSTTYSATIAEFTQQIQSIDDKLNKLTVVKNTEVVGSILADAQKCVKIENTFYCYGISQNSLYKLTDEGKMTMMDLGIQNTEQFEAISSIEHLLILLTKKPSIVVFNTTNSTANVIDLDNTANPIIGMVSYLKYLYLLSSKNEIIKVSGATAGNITTSNWIKGNINQEFFANSISIDGDVYITNTDGSISKFTQGSFIENFHINISNNLNSPEIFTNAVLNNLYLLDKTLQKIVISDKKGNLIQQLQIAELDNIKNIIVESDNTIYVLNKDKIYRINF